MRSVASAMVFLALVMCSLYSQAWASKKVLVVTDVDDTIKVSHVLKNISKVGRAADVYSPFTGMAQLLQLIRNENPASTHIVYLSNAPEELAGIPAASFTHGAFLKQNRFPEGEFILRKNIFDSEHKIKTLRILIESEMPEVLILIGDNGEKDVDVYQQISQEYAYLNHMKVVTFIHQLYSSKNSFFVPDTFEEIGRSLYAGQIGYVTPVEISLKLNELGLIGADKAEWMIQNIAPFIVKEDRFKFDGFMAMTFPRFKNCSDFKWTFERPAELKTLIQRIENECN